MTKIHYINALIYKLQRVHLKGYENYNQSLKRSICLRNLGTNFIGNVQNLTEIPADKKKETKNITLSTKGIFLFPGKLGQLKAGK